MKNYIEWIGTGSGLNPVLGNTSFLVGGGERTLLVDCGCTVPLELIKSNKLKQVTDVIITHAHADHIGGLEVFAFMNYFAYRNREDDKHRRLPFHRIIPTLTCKKSGKLWSEI